MIIDKKELLRSGIYIGKTDTIIADNEQHNEIIEKLKWHSESKNAFKCRYEFKDYNGVYERRIELNQIEDRDKYVIDNNLKVFQKWYESDLSLDLDEVKGLHSCVEYFKNLVDGFIVDIYPDLENNIMHNYAFTLYEDGHFIIPHKDGQNVGRKCAILIYLSDEKDYNDGGGKFITKVDNNTIDVYPFKENFVILDFTENNLLHSVEHVKNGFKRYTYIDFVYNKSEFEKEQNKSRII